MVLVRVDLMLIGLKANMDLKQEFLKKLLSKNNYQIDNYENEDFGDFLKVYNVDADISYIMELQSKIMGKWELRERIINFNEKAIQIPNGTQGLQYNYVFSELFLEENKLTSFTITNLESSGLIFDIDKLELVGVPPVSGSFEILIQFKVIGELESDELHSKSINLIINADPKTLWKNIPSDKEALYWKEDNRSSSEEIGSKRIVVSSKRGRSHQNIGSFRDDDYSFKYFKKTGWTIVAVSDGAGSYPYSRKGSSIACEQIVKYFNDEINLKEFLELEESIKKSGLENDTEVVVKSKKFLYKAVLSAFNKLDEFAKSEKVKKPDKFNHPKAKQVIDNFHSTLIFTLFKKFDFGFVIMTFSVGDCPIGCLNKDLTEANLLNWLDVGEFGGGTRFITQQQIFNSVERPMASRFGYQVVDDFSYLFLMTDGIYDPKFVVEANLEKTNHWVSFVEDLKGNNDDNAKINFDSELSVVESQLNEWMDFWSKGNHDDRTLAIIF